MTGWEILGIEPTGELEEVRRAYARKAKECHLEDDPEGFRQLYEAYRWAQDQARYLRHNNTVRPVEVQTQQVHYLSAGPSWKNLDKYKVYRESSQPGGVQSLIRRRKHKPLPVLGGDEIDLSIIFGHKSNVLPQKSAEENIDFEGIFQRAAQERQRQGLVYREHSHAAQEYIRLFERQNSGWTEWEAYILGKDFLQVQYTSEFIYFLTDYLKEQQGGGCPMPYSWIVALFVAYSMWANATDVLQSVVTPLWDLFARQRHSEAFAQELAKDCYAYRKTSFSYYNRVLVLCNEGSLLSTTKEVETLFKKMQKDGSLMQDPGHYTLFTYLGESPLIKDTDLRRKIHHSFEEYRGIGLLRKRLARWFGYNNT